MKTFQRHILIVLKRPTLTSPIKAESHYVMAVKGRCHIYETAFDSKVDKKSEESGDLIDRIANHPILQLLHIRRHNKQTSGKGNPSNTRRSFSANENTKQSDIAESINPVPSTSTDPKQRVGIYTPKSGRYSRFPARSVSTNQLSEQRIRPIGLSKSDDEILNRASDSPEEDDCLEDYREGSHAQDLANDLHSLHVTTQISFAKVSHLPQLKDPPLIDANCNLDKKVPSEVHCSSAHFRSGDKYCIPSHNSSRPFTSSLSKFGSKVQPQKYHNERRVNLMQGELSKSQLLPLKRGLQPLRLQSPPGTAPLPIKFSKKTPVSEKSPSSWFSPIRQKDMNLPIKKSSLSQHEMNRGSSNSSRSSLNDSMVVLLDTGSQRDLKDCLLPPSVNVKYSSVDSIVTGSALSSMESLRSSKSDGSKSIASNESAISSYRSSSAGSDSSLVTRPFLNLNAPHRSLIQSAKFQILSPISDKSQEPSLETGGCISQKNSPQDLFELTCLAGHHQKTPSQTPRNIQDDFRNVHHILPHPPAQGQPGSDSGISIEYKNHTKNQKRSQHLDIPFSDLPFDMPKLRRRMAAAKASLSSSNSSISSSAPSSEPNVRFSLPPSTVLSINQAGSSLNPAISKLQVSCGVSRTSSSNSSDWDTRSSAESSEGQGTPKMLQKVHGRRSLALELGCSAMSAKGQDIDVNIPLTKQNWYHGVLNRQEAEAILRSHAEGSYIVRSIRSSKDVYSLALKSARGFMHFRMHFDHSSGGYTIGRSDQLFPSVPHIVSHFSVYRIPIKGAEHMVLLYPIPSEIL
ncbi:UNVERIFIED_CONTAM: hypothetical protein RMT77_006678 [Armadillidium vulgare]